MLVKNRRTDIPKMPQTAAKAAADLARVLARLRTDAERVESYFAANGEPFEGLPPARFTDMLAQLREINPPPATATTASLVWMLTDAVRGLTEQLEAVRQEVPS